MAKLIEEAAGESSIDGFIKKLNHNPLMVSLRRIAGLQFKGGNKNERASDLKGTKTPPIPKKSYGLATVAKRALSERTLLSLVGTLELCL